MKEFDRVKAKAIGRLVVDNSACWGNFHLKSDLNDYHTYWAIPENKNQFDKTIDDVPSRPKWLYSEFGDSQERGDEPLLLSEFGNWGLPKLPEKLPWWFERQFLDIELSLPAGTHKRFIDHKLDKIFGSYNQLAEESQRSQFNSLKYEIETCARSPPPSPTSSRGEQAPWPAHLRRRVRWRKIGAHEDRGFHERCAP